MSTTPTVEAKPKLPLGKTVLWILNLFFIVLVLFYTFWAVTASSYQHTYLRPSTAPSGSLYSERFTADFFFTGSLLLLFFVPFSFAWLLGNPSSVSRQTVHITVTILILMYMIVILLFWGIGFYMNVNQATASNAFNPANDDRWCGVHFNIAGSACANTVGLNGLTHEQLTVNSVFLYKFFFLIVFIVLLIVHFAFVASKFPALRGIEPEEIPKAQMNAKIAFKIPYRNRK